MLKCATIYANYLIEFRGQMKSYLLLIGLLARDFPKRLFGQSQYLHDALNAPRQMALSCAEITIPSQGATMLSFQ